ncbi:MAG: hypothetical protein EBS81_11975 [Gammaproteobacteria bacterium]|nr:hypothetical protein [Gammaproteobacteria bacterium]
MGVATAGVVQAPTAQTKGIEIAIQKAGISVLADLISETLTAGLWLAAGFSLSRVRLLRLFFPIGNSFDVL